MSQGIACSKFNSRPLGEGGETNEEEEEQEEEGGREGPTVLILMLQLHLEYAKELLAARNMQREEVKLGLLSF